MNEKKIKTTLRIIKYVLLAYYFNQSDLKGSWFGNQFISMLDWNGTSIGSAFESAYSMVQEYAEQSHVQQYPLIDDNGDGVGH